MDYYGPDSGREQYFKNMGLSPDGQSPLSPAPPIQQPSALEPAQGLYGQPQEQPIQQPQMGAPEQSVSTMAPSYGDARQGQMNRQQSYQQPSQGRYPSQGSAPMQDGSGYANHQQHQQMRPPMQQPKPNFSQGWNTGGNPQNTRPRQPNPAQPPAGQPMIQNRRPNPVGA